MTTAIGTWSLYACSYPLLARTMVGMSQIWLTMTVMTKFETRTFISMQSSPAPRCAEIFAQTARLGKGFTRANPEFRVRRSVDAASGAAGGTGCPLENHEPTGAN